MLQITAILATSVQRRNTLHQLRGRLGLTHEEVAGDLRGRLAFAMRGRHPVTRVILLVLAREWARDPVPVRAPIGLVTAVCDDEQVARLLEEHLPEPGLHDRRAVLLPWLARITDDLIARLRWDDSGSEREFDTPHPRGGIDTDWVPSGGWETILPQPSDHAQPYWTYLEYLGELDGEVGQGPAADTPIRVFLDMLYPWEGIDWMNYLVDWIEGAGAAAGDWTKFSLAEALDRALLWHHEILLESLRKERVAALYEGRAVVRSWDNGWTLRALRTAQDLAVESSALGHCVRSYANNLRRKNRAYYSLHDPSGEPRITIELQVDPDGVLPPEPLQVYGRANTPPSGERCVPTFWALYDLGVDLDSAARSANIGWLYDIVERVSGEQGRIARSQKQLRADASADAIVKAAFLLIDPKTRSKRREEVFRKIIQDDGKAGVRMFVVLADRDPRLLTPVMARDAWETVSASMPPLAAADELKVRRLTLVELERLGFLQLLPGIAAQYVVGRRGADGRWEGFHASMDQAVELVALGAHVGDLSSVSFAFPLNTIDVRSYEDLVVLRALMTDEARARRPEIPLDIARVRLAFLRRRMLEPHSQLVEIAAAALRYLPIYVHDVVGSERSYAGIELCIGRIRSIIGEGGPTAPLAFDRSAVYVAEAAGVLFENALVCVSPKYPGLKQHVVQVLHRALFDGTGWPFSTVYGYAAVDDLRWNPDPHKAALIIQYDEHGRRFEVVIQLLGLDHVERGNIRGPVIMHEQKRCVFPLPTDMDGWRALQRRLSELASLLEERCRVEGSYAEQEACPTKSMHIFRHRYDPICVYDGLCEGLSTE